MRTRCSSRSRSAALPAGRALPARPDRPGGPPPDAGPGGGHHHHPGAGHPGPPGQVQILAELIDGGVEAAQGPEQVGPHQRGAPRGDEDLAHAVVLLLVQLARLDQILDHADLVGGGPDGQQPVRIVPLHVLRGGDAGVGPEGLLHQAPDGIRRQDHVVVAEQQVGCPFHPLEHLVGGPAEADPPLQAHHEGAREARRPPGRWDPPGWPRRSPAPTGWGSPGRPGTTALARTTSRDRR